MFGGAGGTAFRPTALLPVVSWFDDEPYGTRSYLLSPDDRDADEPDAITITRWRAPLIDLGAALVLAVLAGRIGWEWPLATFLVFGASLVVVAAIDIDHYRIPDRVVFPTLAACVPLLVLAAVLHDEPEGLIGAVAGAFAYFAFLFVFFFVYPKGMGFGDVKLALVLGWHTGWAGSVASIDGNLIYAGWSYGMQLVLMGALMGSLLGAILGIGSLIARGRKGAFPFGPALCLGALLAVVFSEQILN